MRFKWEDEGEFEPAEDWLEQFLTWLTEKLTEENELDIWWFNEKICYVLTVKTSKTNDATRVYSIQCV